MIIERATKYEPIGGHTHAVPTCDADKAMMRLARYEDTGREPEEVEALSSLFEFAVENSATMTQQLELIDRIRELAEADKEGRVVVLPCKVGDTVYRVFAPGRREPVIQETQVKTLGQAADLVGRIGKLSKLVGVFRTREEAEKALEGM